MKAEGMEPGDVSIPEDGAMVVFVGGAQPNGKGWVANPTANPEGATRTIWAVRTAGGAAWKLGEGTTPVLSPDGGTVAYGKDGQIYRYSVGVAGAGRAGLPTELSAVARSAKAGGATPWIRAWGTNSNMKWSPDGSKLAFVSNRVDHSLI